MKTMFVLMLSILFVPLTFTSLTFAEAYTQWSLPEGAKVRLGKGRVNGLVYSPDGKYLAVVSNIGTWLYDTESYQEHALLIIRHTSRVWSVSFSPDGRTLASGSTDNTIRLWSVETGQTLKTLKGHKGDVCGISFSPDGQTLASRSWEDDIVFLWDVSEVVGIR